MTESIYPISEYAKQRTYCTEEQYQTMYKASLEQPEAFWSEQANASLTWDAPYHTIVQSDMNTGDTHWFEGGKLNVSVNCIDRHLPHNAHKTALLFEGDEPGNDVAISYQQLHDNVCRVANVLKARGVKKGDRVCIYLPMVLEAAYTMLACARIGAIHSVVFGGFSASALRDRLIDAQCCTIVTADQSVRGGKATPLKANVDVALEGLDFVHSCIVVQRTGAEVSWSDIDVWYHEAIQAVPSACEPVPMASEDPLFILYTSGSTGKPKGVMHTTAGYLLHATMTFKYAFDNFDDEVFWCTADVGWVTGHTYSVYGPLSNGATSLVFEGVPTYPDAGRCWQIVEQHRVAQFYTAPTAIRALMAQDDHWVTQYDRSSLRLLGSVGEPINPEAWEWYYRVVGEERCSLIDTWWQTETGGHMMLPLPGACPPKPGAASKPFFGVEPVLLDSDGHEIQGAGEGALAIKRSWPSQIRSVYGDHRRMYDTYFSAYKGYYFTGDGARQDDDGYWWITGRMDDVLNVSGHRMGTAEIESAIVAHPATAEAAVVGYPHDVKGQGVYAYVILKEHYDVSPQIEQEIIALCRKEIGPIAKPDLIHFTTGLPKTRSGKIMRRILRKIACDEVSNLGDTSTLIDPSVVDTLISSRLNNADINAVV